MTFENIEKKFCRFSSFLGITEQRNDQIEKSLAVKYIVQSFEIANLRILRKKFVLYAFKDSSET